MTMGYVAGIPVTYYDSIGGKNSCLNPHHDSTHMNIPSHSQYGGQGCAWFHSETEEAFGPECPTAWGPVHCVDHPMDLIRTAQTSISSASSP